MSSTSPNATSSTSSGLDEAWSEIQTSLSSMRTKLSSWTPPPPRIMRVGGLDAELLDLELLNLLKEPVNKALGLLGSVYETRFDPEIALFISAVLYKYSMWDIGATYGAKLQDLRYKPSKPSGGLRLAPSGLPRKALLAHATLTLVIPYIHNRIRMHALRKAWPDAPSADRKRRAWEWLVRLESLHSTLALAGFISFLYDGRYRTLADRMLKFQLVATRSIVRRNVSYEFMNRQMVWHSFTEFLIFLLPLINARSVRRRLSRIVSSAATTATSAVPSSVKSYFGVSLGSQTSSSEQKPLTRKGKYWALSEDQCAICAEDASFDISNLAQTLSDSTAAALASSSLLYRPAPQRPTEAATLPSDSSPEDLREQSLEPPTFPITTPYCTSCGHIYCYFCLSQRMIRVATDEDAQVDEGGEAGWECLRCTSIVQSCKRVEERCYAEEMGSQDGLSDDERASVLEDSGLGSSGELVASD